MQFANYFFASLVSFLGIVAGIALIRIAPEEQKPLESYFAFAGKLLLFLMFFFILFYYSNNTFYLMAIALSIIFLLFAEYKVNDPFKRSIIIYGLLGIIFFLSYPSTNLFLMESSLIFIYGMVNSSLLFRRKSKSHNQIFYSAIFILTANILFLL